MLFCSGTYGYEYVAADATLSSGGMSRNFCSMMKSMITFCTVYIFLRNHQVPFRCTNKSHAIPNTCKILTNLANWPFALLSTPLLSSSSCIALLQSHTSSCATMKACFPSSSTCTPPSSCVLLWSSWKPPLGWERRDPLELLVSHIICIPPLVGTEKTGDHWRRHDHWR